MTDYVKPKRRYIKRSKRNAGVGDSRSGNGSHGVGTPDSSGGNRIPSGTASGAAPTIIPAASPDPAARTAGSDPNSGGNHRLNANAPTTAPAGGSSSPLKSAIKQAKKQGAARVSLQVDEKEVPESNPDDRFARYRERAKLAKESDVTASLLLDVLDGIAQGFVDKEAALTNEERDLIVKPLSRLVQRLDLDTQEKIQTYSDPVMLTLALGMWASRVSVIYRKKNPPKEKSQPTLKQESPAPEAVKSNGNGASAAILDETTLAAAANPNSDPVLAAYLNQPVSNGI